MKGLLILLAFIFAYNAWSGVEYPVKNFTYLSDFQYQDEVENSSQYVFMVFSSKECLERTIVERNCFLFEKKLDRFIPSFSSKVKFVGFNTYFENYQIASMFFIQKRPTVILIKNNSVLKRMEASYEPADITLGRLSWEDELLKEVLSTAYQIR